MIKEKTGRGTVKSLRLYHFFSYENIWGDVTETASSATKLSRSQSDPDFLADHLLVLLLKALDLFVLSPQTWVSIKLRSLANTIREEGFVT